MYFFFCSVLFTIYCEENITIIRNPNNRNDFNEDYWDSTIIYDTNIESIQNNSTKILLETDSFLGFYFTGFYLKRDYYNNFKKTDNLFVVSTINDLKELQDKYIFLPYLETFSADYFEHNYLVLILSGYTGSSELRNERIEENNGKFSFVVEYWYKGTPNDGEVLYLIAITALYVLEIPKK